MRFSVRSSLLAAIAAVALASPAGCRFVDDDWTMPDSGEFDAAVDDDAGPGELCPADAPDLFNNAYSPYMGGETSVDIEVVDYSYFRCPHCADFAVEWEEIFSARPDFRDRVRFYFHHYPFNTEDAWRIHAATVAAGNQGMEYFWRLHDYIFGQKVNEGHTVTVDEAQAFCQNELGLEMSQFEADLAADATYAFLAWDKEQAQAIGVSSTPSVFVCGDKISWGNLEAVLDGYLYP